MSCSLLFFSHKKLGNKSDQNFQQKKLERSKKAYGPFVCNPQKFITDTGQIIFVILCRICLKVSGITQIIYPSYGRVNEEASHVHSVNLCIIFMNTCINRAGTKTLNEQRKKTQNFVKVFCF